MNKTLGEELLDLIAEDALVRNARESYGETIGRTPSDIGTDVEAVVRKILA